MDIKTIEMDIVLR